LFSFLTLCHGHEKGVRKPDLRKFIRLLGGLARNFLKSACFVSSLTRRLAGVSQNSLGNCKLPL